MTDILVASAGEDVRLWKTPELNLHAVKNGANANVVHCCCSSNGKKLKFWNVCLLESSKIIIKFSKRELPIQILLL